MKIIFLFLKQGMMVGASYSSRKDLIFEPFPPDFMNRGTKDFNGIVWSPPPYLIKLFTYPLLFGRIPSSIRSHE